MQFKKKNRRQKRGLLQTQRKSKNLTKKAKLNRIGLASKRKRPSINSRNGREKTTLNMLNITKMSQGLDDLIEKFGI